MAKRAARLAVPALNWCRVCGTRHTVLDRCPGELLSTGPERHGWRASVGTPQGLEVIGVLISPVEELWRARILTYPNILWMIPGGGASMKFVGENPREAEQQAIEFIELHAKTRRYSIGHELPPVEAGHVDPEHDHKTVQDSFTRTSRRKLRSVRVRYGVDRLRHSSETADLSVGGVFIVTDAPIEIGRPILLQIDLERSTIPMHGVVRWLRKRSRPGRPAGIGVELVRPPALYVHFVRELP